MYLIKYAESGKHVVEQLETNEFQINCIPRQISCLIKKLLKSSGSIVIKLFCKRFINFC